MGTPMDNLNQRLVKTSVKKETQKDHIYHDIKEDEKEYAYAYADVKANTVPEDTGKHGLKGLIELHAQPVNGGRVHDDKSHYPSDSTDYAYACPSEITDQPIITGEHVYATSVSGSMPQRANETEDKNENEGWKDNEIYVAENNVDFNENQEGWADNSIYADSDKVSKVKGQRDEDEGWKDNVVYSTNGK